MHLHEYFDSLHDDHKHSIYPQKVISDFTNLEFMNGHHNNVLLHVMHGVYGW